jgi:hypothetical protein
VRIKTTKSFPQISQIHFKVQFRHGYTLMLEMVTIVSRNISWMQPMKQLNMHLKKHHFFLGEGGDVEMYFSLFFNHVFNMFPLMFPKSLMYSSWCFLSSQCVNPKGVPHGHHVFYPICFAHFFPFSPIQLGERGGTFSN